MIRAMIDLNQLNIMIIILILGYSDKVRGVKSSERIFGAIAKQPGGNEASFGDDDQAGWRRGGFGPG
jgi:hypothetical protein